MKFEFSTSGRILFGSGGISNLPAIAETMGKRALVVSGRGGADPEAACLLLSKTGISCEQFSIASEPTVQDLRSGRDLVLEKDCDFLIGFGGGSVIDAAKGISVMVTNPGDPLDYMEVIGKGEKIEKAPIPVIAIPTTAGTGTEVTKNAVISSPEHHYKASLRSPMLAPRVALVDPQLSYSLPPAATASTGMDALTQLIEPFVSIRANPLTDGFCREGIRLAKEALRVVYVNGKDPSAREAMSLASLMSGLALANAGLGAVHGFASPLGGMFEAPHGVICARLLAPVVEINISALKSRDPESQVLKRYQEVSQIITGEAELAELIRWLEELTRDLQIPGLRTYGIQEADFPRIVASAAQASSMKANPLPLTENELYQILEKAI